MSVQQPGPDATADGLERHPSLDDRFDPAVRIVDYDPAWPALAEAELRCIKETLGETAVRLEHVGSTAVPGLAAKPIIDLQLSVAAIRVRERYVEPLERHRGQGWLRHGASHGRAFHKEGRGAPERGTHDRAIAA